MTAAILSNVNFGKTRLPEKKRWEDSLWEKLSKEEIRRKRQQVFEQTDGQKEKRIRWREN